MANARRGEITAELGGVERTLCLTLGALAELESAFASEDLPDLARRFENGRIRSADLIKIIACGLRGAGHKISDGEVATLTVPCGLQGYVGIVSSLFQATFGGLQEATDPLAPRDQTI